MKPFIVPEELKDFISGYDKKTPEIWNNLNSNEINVFRIQARKHYLYEQRNQCCYCKVLIPSMNGLHWQIEHILPKCTFPQFLFEPYNLAVICPDCNNIKNDSNPHVDGERAFTQISYPKTGRRFKIVHPHFDNYNEHLFLQPANHCDYPGYFFIIGKTAKGKATIKMCDLNRFFQNFGGHADMKGKQIQQIDSFIKIDLSTATRDEKNAAVMAILNSI